MEEISFHPCASADSNRPGLPCALLLLLWSLLVDPAGVAPAAREDGDEERRPFESSRETRAGQRSGAEEIEHPAENSRVYMQARRWSEMWRIARAGGSTYARGMLRAIVVVAVVLVAAMLTLARLRTNPRTVEIRDRYGVTHAVRTNQWGMTPKEFEAWRAKEEMHARERAQAGSAQ